MENSIIGDIDPNTYVYRIFSVERLFQLFETRQNVLVHPSKWDDPFENCILSGHIELATGNKGRFGFKDHVFGQCWTTKRESDAMWRIYSPDKNGVRVRARVSSLISGLRQADQDFSDVRCFIGKVNYLHEKKFSDLSINVLDGSGKGIAKSLLYKRMEFNHEKEVRIIYNAPQNGNSPERIFGYCFDPLDTVDEITYDPRISDRMSEVYTHSLVDTYQFPKKQINKSKLYSPPSSFVTKLRA